MAHVTPRKSINSRIYSSTVHSPMPINTEMFARGNLLTVFWCSSCCSCVLPPRLIKNSQVAREASHCPSTSAVLHLTLPCVSRIWYELLSDHSVFLQVLYVTIEYRSHRFLDFLSAYLLHATTNKWFFGFLFFLQNCTQICMRNHKLLVKSSYFLFSSSSSSLLS